MKQPEDETTLHEADGFSGGNDFRDPAQQLRDDVQQFVDDCTKLAAKPITDDTEREVAELVVRELRLRQLAEGQHKTEKKPYLDECNRLDKELRDCKAKLLTSLGEKGTGTGPREKLRLHLIELKKKRDAAEAVAREEAAEAQRQAIALAESAPDVAAELVVVAQEATRGADALAEAPKIASLTGRSIGLKDVQTVRVTDWTAALAHVQTHPKVQEAALAALTALAKASKFKMPLPGCEFDMTQEVA